MKPLLAAFGLGRRSDGRDVDSRRLLPFEAVGSAAPGDPAIACELVARWRHAEARGLHHLVPRR